MDSVEEYILQFEEPIQEKLRLCRNIILETVPHVQEKISWGVPTYYLNGYLLQFAACQKFLGFYVSPHTIAHFQNELKAYPTNKKNTIHFSYQQALPIKLIKAIIQYRVLEVTKDAP